MEWCPLTCTFDVAKVYLDKGILITRIHIFPLFVMDRPLIPDERNPPCFRCHLGEDDSAEPRPHTMRTLSKMDSHLLPLPTNLHNTSYTSKRMDMPRCEQPSMSQPCPHQVCTIQFTPIPHKAADIRKLHGGKLALAKNSQGIDKFLKG